MELLKRAHQWALPEILLWKRIKSIGFILALLFFCNKGNLFLKEMIYWQIYKWY